MSEQEPTKQPIPTIWASVGGTFPSRTTQFQNVKLDMGIAGIPINITDDELQKRLEACILTVERTMNVLSVELERRLREEFGIT